MRIRAPSASSSARTRCRRPTSSRTPPAGRSTPNLTYYTPNAGYPTLRKAIAEQVRSPARRRGRSRRRGRRDGERDGRDRPGLPGHGQSGDSALVITPLWPNIAAAVQSHRRRGDRGPASPWETRASRSTSTTSPPRSEPDTRLLALASPGNPTGWTASATDWGRLLAFCERHDLWLLADGVYERIVSGDRVAPARCPGRRRVEDDRGPELLEDLPDDRLACRLRDRAAGAGTSPDRPPGVRRQPCRRGRPGGGPGRDPRG